MSFFLKGKPRNAVKRKFEPKHKKSKNNAKSSKDSTVLDEDNESIDSDLEFHDVPDRSESEGEYETAQEKKLRLAKKYLEEIEKAEASRNEDKEFDSTAVAKRLTEDYLESKGKLHKIVAGTCVAPDSSDVRVLRCREHRLTPTCLCLTADGSLLYSGSKCGSIVKWDLIAGTKVGVVKFKKGANNGKIECHKTGVTSMAVSTDGNFLVSCDRSNMVQVWDGRSLGHLGTLQGHRGSVTGLAFRRDSHQLFSCSDDRTVKVWSLDEMAHVETLFGHQAPVMAVDALSKERAVTAGGRDCTVRIWKIAEESQLVFNGHSGSIDAVKLIDEEHFVTCGDDGSVCVWGNMKKKPLCMCRDAHGVGVWVTSVAALPYTDLVASGSSDGWVRLWRLSPGCRSLEEVVCIPVTGFVNGLVFTPDGLTLIAAVGQEHRSARWFKEVAAKNAIYIIPIRKKES